MQDINRKTWLDFIPAGVAIIIGVLLLLCSGGCSSGAFRFAPTESQKQAQLLVVTNLEYLTPLVVDEGQPLLEEAKDAALPGLAYMGLPKEPVKSQTPSAVASVKEAAEVAADRPTTGQVLNDTLDRAFFTAERVVGFLAIFGISGGAGIALQKLKAARKSVVEIVTGVQAGKTDMPYDAKKKLNKALDDAQSEDTRVAVAVIKAKK